MSVNEGPQLSLFSFDRLARRPYCADDLGYGLRIRSQSHALKHSYIQANSPLLKWRLVFDIDRSASVFAAEDANVATPNWIAENPRNGHAHVGYEIETAIVTSTASLAQSAANFLIKEVKNMTHALMLMLALCFCAPALGQNETSFASLSEAKKALKEKDYAVALKLLKPLAEQGNSEAQANLGLMYEHGRGVDKDFVEAFRWYRSAAEQGTIWAQTNLGLAYANGRGIEKNDQEATKWYRRAALQGNTMSQKLLVSMYEAGRGTPKDHNEIVKFINPSNLMYISGLQKDYGNKIRFESKNAEKIILNFNIDCKSNGRHLPLNNALLARLSDANESDISMNTNILEKDGEVRIIDSYRTSNGKLVENFIFKINKWGELRSMGGVTISAVLNACFGSYGPIWLLE